MVLALTPEREFDYILDEERGLDPDRQTVWRLRALSYSERERVLGRVGSNIAGKAQLGRYAHESIRDALRCGLLGWLNFPDPNTGAEAPFDTVAPGGNEAWIKRPAIPTDQTLELIPFEYWPELAQAIIHGSQLQEGDRKN